jgi:hypothetical protein
MLGGWSHGHRETGCRTAAKYSNDPDRYRLDVPAGGARRAETPLVDPYAGLSHREGQGFDSPQLHTSSAALSGDLREGSRTPYSSKISGRHTAVQPGRLGDSAESSSYPSLASQSHFAGCANQDRDFHIQLSRRPSQRLRPEPNRPDKYRFHVSVTGEQGVFGAGIRPSYIPSSSTEAVSQPLQRRAGGLRGCSGVDLHGHRSARLSTCGG